MKILNVSNIFFTLPYFFGDQLSHFSKKGYDITVTCGPDDNLRSFADKHSVKLKEIFIPRTFALKEDWKAFMELYKFIKEEHFDIVCGHTPIGGLLAVTAAKLAGIKKRVFFRHGLVYETSHGLKRMILINAERFASLMATNVVCVSHYLIERSVQDSLTNRSKMMLLNEGSCNGIDSEGRFNPSNIDRDLLTSIRKKWKIPEDAFVIGYAGRMVQDKGIEELVTAFKIIRSKVPNAFLLLVGMLEERDAITEQTREEIKSNPHIIHTGLILHNVEYYYSLMDVLVLCTHREGLGQTLIEAAAMGVPTLTTSHTGSRDAIRNNVTGMFVNMGDPDSIFEKVMMYVADEKLRKLHGKQGRDFVMRTFKQELVWDEIERKIYGITNLAGTRS